MKRCVMPIPLGKILFESDSMFARVPVWKGRKSSREQRLATHRVEDFTNPVELIRKWDHRLDGNVRLFVRSREPEVFRERRRG